MKTYFSYRGRTITPGDPWPPRNGGFSHPVLLHHDLAQQLIVHSWEGARLQVDRLDALQRDGYQRRPEIASDWALWHDLMRAGDHCGGVIDHPRYFRHCGEPIIVCHSYRDDDHVREVLPGACQVVSDRWHCPITFEIDQRFNIYFPESGVGYAIRRPRGMRGPHWRRFA